MPTAVHLLLLAFAMLWPGPERPGHPEPGDHPPSPHIHSHNDFYQPRPLIDALAWGATSVEADVMLHDGELVVAHARHEIDPDRTLESLYLRPLREFIERHNGAVLQPWDMDRPFILLVDIKDSPEATYRALHQLLERYAPILTRVEDGELHPGPVWVVISGRRPVEMIRNQSVRYVAIDGRPSDLDPDHPDAPPRHLFPLISSRWSSHFSWRGNGPMPPAERRQLRQMVDAAHAQGRLIRFWAAPDHEDGWRAQLEAGVDLINTDRPGPLHEFLQRMEPD